MSEKQVIEASFSGCAFVFARPGKRPPEGEPMGLDIAQFGFDVWAVVDSANVVPWSRCWREKRRARRRYR